MHLHKTYWQSLSLKSPIPIIWFQTITTYWPSQQLRIKKNICVTRFKSQLSSIKPDKNTVRSATTAPTFKTNAQRMTLVSRSINSSLWLNHEEQRAHRLGSHSNECAATGQYDHLLSTAAVYHSVWHRRNKPERPLTVLHLKHAQKHNQQMQTVYFIWKWCHKMQTKSEIQQFHTIYNCSLKCLFFS